MSDFVKYLKQISEEFRLLNEDVEKIVAEKKNEGKVKVPSLKSIQSITKMYNNKEELQKAKESPEVDFIKNRINRIFSK